MQFKKLFDISVILGRESTDYPGDPPFSLEEICSVDNGDAVTLHRVNMSTHAGSHVDFPAHIFPAAGSLNIDDFPASRFILPAVVVEVPGNEDISPEILRDISFSPGSAILFSTANSRSGLASSGEYDENYVALSLEAARTCIQMQAGLVGIDYITVEHSEDKTLPVHRTLLEAGAVILEGINLQGVLPGKYTLVCLPLNIGGAEGAPCRPILLK